jgi:hypothetical protein
LGAPQNAACGKGPFSGILSMYNNLFYFIFSCAARGADAIFNFPVALQQNRHYNAPISNR